MKKIMEARVINGLLRYIDGNGKEPGDFYIWGDYPQTSSIPYEQSRVEPLEFSFYSLLK